MAWVDSGLTRGLAARVVATRWEALDPPVRQAAAQAVLDMVGCALAGAHEPLADILFAELAEAGGTPEAALIGREARLPMAAAALLNGAAGHALDFDDVNMAMPGHPTVAILPALLALGEARGASGAALLTALVAGTDLACRVGRTLAPGHYDGLGFHATRPWARWGRRLPAGICWGWTRIGSRWRSGSRRPRRRG